MLLKPGKGTIHELSQEMTRNVDRTTALTPRRNFEERAFGYISEF